MGFTNINELIKFLPNTNINNNLCTTNNNYINNNYINVPLVLKKKKNKSSYKIYKNTKKFKFLKKANHLLELYIIKTKKKSDKLKSNKIKSNKIKSDKIKSDKIKSDKIKSDKLESKTSISDKIKSNKLESEIIPVCPSFTTKEEVYKWSKTTKHEIQLRIDNELSAQLLNFELNF